MKKLISLVALAGMFLLMSFSMSAMKEKPSEELQDACHTLAMNTALRYPECSQYAIYGNIYDTCLAAN